MLATSFRIYGITTLSTLLMIGSVLSTAQASDSVSESISQTQIELALILRHSGMARLYKDLAATVLTESRLARQTCDDSSIEAGKVHSFITQVLDVEQLMNESVKQLSQHTEAATIDQVAVWVSSAPGQRILEAEAKSADWSDEEFAQRKLALFSSPDWNVERQRLITLALQSAATVPFVTGLHSETSALVLQASDCIASDASSTLLTSQIKQARGEEALYGAFLRNGMRSAAAVIFSDISNAELKQYIVHNQSAAGRAWNEALLKTIRQVLRDRYIPVHQYLAAMNQK